MQSLYRCSDDLRHIKNADGNKLPFLKIPALDPDKDKGKEDEKNAISQM